MAFSYSCDGFVHLVLGDDGKCYGTYLMADQAETRLKKLVKEYGD